MKTLKTMLHTFLVCAFFFTATNLFTSCDGTTPKTDTENPQPPKQDDEDDTPKPKTVKRPNIIISSKEAKRHYDLYTPRARRIEKEMRVDPEHENFRATRSLYLSKEDLEHYLAYIEQESEKVGVKPNGIRFFFSVYPEEYKRADGSTADAKKQTVFFAPTIDRRTDGGVKFPAYTIGGDQNNEVILLQDILNGKRVAAHGQDQNTIQEASLFNFFMTTVGDEKSLVGNSLSEWHDDE